MSDQEINKEVEQRPAEGTSSAAESGIAGELQSQLSDFVKKNADNNVISDMKPSPPSTFIEFEREKKIGYGAEDQKKLIESFGTALGDMLKGELPQLRDMLKRQGMSTAEVDAKIKAAEKEAAAAKPMHDAVLKGDITALQKMVATMKPEEMEKMTELLQKHFDRQGLGIELDAVDGKLIVSRSNGDRAVAISKDKTDVIGVNADGSYDFNRHYRRENAGKELQGMADGAMQDHFWRGHRRFDNHWPEYTTKAMNEGGMVPRDYLDSRIMYKNSK